MTITIIRVTLFPSLVLIVRPILLLLATLLLLSLPNFEEIVDLSRLILSLVLLLLLRLRLLVLRSLKV